MTLNKNCYFALIDQFYIENSFTDIKMWNSFDLKYVN